jgi:hypothetical protein
MRRRALSLTAGVSAIVAGNYLVQGGGQFAQPFQVRGRQLLQYALTCVSQADADNAAIAGIGCALDQSRGLGPINELHRAVRPQEQVAGEIADRRRRVSRVPLDRHQELMLNLGQPGRLRLFFAPVLKAPQADTEIQQPLEVSLGQPSHSASQLAEEIDVRKISAACRLTDLSILPASPCFRAVPLCPSLPDRASACDIYIVARSI